MGTPLPGLPTCTPVVGGTALPPAGTPLPPAGPGGPGGPVAPTSDVLGDTGAPSSDVLGLPPSGTGGSAADRYLLLTVLLSLGLMALSVILLRERPGPARALTPAGYTPAWRRLGAPAAAPATSAQPAPRAPRALRRAARLVFPPLGQPPDWRRRP
jgi:hypothetical protein